MPFTNVKIKALKPKRERYTSWEDGKTCLGVRVSPAGRKTFIFMYRFEGKARRMTIGPYPRMNLATARLKVAEAKEKLSKGMDPGEEWVKKKATERKAETIEDLVDVYLEKWAKPRKKSWREDERILGYDILPEWGKRKARKITRQDVISLIDSIVARGAPIQANRTFSCIRKMFNFALVRGIIDATPCGAIPSPSKEVIRERVLKENEIRAFWLGLETAKMSDSLKLALKFQFVTAQRKGEILAAQWEEIDFHDKTWTIPGEKSKNGFLHRVPLCPMAIDILEKIKFLKKDSSWLFPSLRSKNKPVIPTSASHALHNNIEHFGIDPFTPHDLRRTAASQMTSMGIPRLVVSKILNHVESGVTAIYDRHSYDKEKRQALEKWGRKVEYIITGKKAGKVIAFNL